ncbi:hypothetical protein L1049_020229 [Liquidambar formosana]|uniref:Reverse transcriptase domain-containing protein n=1 Tax=Liquidambar formosana TaxID=63359 RepID=A0AAP0SCT1_LIQFO
MANLKAARGRISFLKFESQNLQDSSNIQTHVVDYYKSLYTANNSVPNNGLVADIIPSLVTDNENDMLSSVPLVEDIRAAVFSMNPHSAPRLDGFGGLFYQSYWDIVGEDVVKAITMFFEKSWLLVNFISNFVVLIPKVPKADTITQYRPIALANFLFKIIPKILSHKLSSIAARIISPNQTAFTKGRKIVENFGLASEYFNLLDNKCFGGNGGIKFDVFKAFDTIEW